MSAEATTGIPASRRRVLRGLATAVAMTIVTLAASRLPDGVPSGGLDSSWASVLRYASGRGLAFGTDVVFTYGPLGYVMTRGYSGGDVIHVRWVNLALVLACVAPIVLVARRVSWQAAAALLLLVACLPLMFAAGADGLVQAGLCCWGLLAFLSHEGRGARSRLDATLLLALAASVAIIGLAKFSWLVAGAATVCAVAIDAWLRGSRVRACITVGVTAGLWLAGWVAIGQPVENVVAYLTGGWQIAAGYARAMGTRGDNDILVLAMLAAGACAAGVVMRGRAADLPGATQLRGRRWLLVAWLLGMLFIGWKHGIGRAANRDTHVTALMAQCVVLAFALPIIPVVPVGADRAGGVRAWLVAVLALALAQVLQFPSLEDGVAKAGQRIVTNTTALVNPAAGQRRLERRWQMARDQLALPSARELIGDATVDVFGHSQDHAIATGLNYVPRPVFQSYSAYTRGLAELNDRFYHSPRAPAWVLLELASIDDRCPGLDDPLALRTILRHYRMVGSDRQFLVLRREQREPVQLELVASGTVRVAERVDVTDFGGRDLWLEIDVSPGIVARAEAFVVRPPPTRIRLWADGLPEEGHAYLAPPPMLATGFIASPVLMGTADAAAVLAGGATRRLRAFAVETSRSYRDTPIRYRLHAIVGNLSGE
jgi:hypothetical protein